MPSIHMQYQATSQTCKTATKISCRKVPNLIFYPLSQIEDLGVYELATTALNYCYYHSGAQSKLTSTLQKYRHLILSCLIILP